MLIPSHMVWGYLLGRITAHAVSRPRVHAPLLLLMGALPDVDLFTRQPYGTPFGHHGVSHSWLVILWVAVPWLLHEWRTTLPYLVATIQHPLFGDLVANEVPLLGPLSWVQEGVRLGFVAAPLAVALEVFGAALFFVIALRQGEVFIGRQTRPWLLVLAAPFLALAVRTAAIAPTPDLLLALYASYGIVLSAVLAAIYAVAFARSDTIVGQWLGRNRVT